MRKANPGAAGVPPVTVTWECLSNLIAENSFTARLILKNVSDAPIGAGWAVCFNTSRKVIQGSVSAGYGIEHVNGDLFRLVQAGPARDWLPGHKHELRYDANYWAISHTDAPLGFYLEPAGGAAAVDLGDPCIVPFLRPGQRHRHAEDQSPVADAAWRFRENESASLLPLDAVGRITPSPVLARFGSESCVLGPGSAVLHDGLQTEAGFLHAMLEALPHAGAAAARIELALDEPTQSPEAYRIVIGQERVRLSAATAHGIFNAIQTLSQLIDPATGAVPLGEVQDAPRFAHRGVLLDVARHFSSAETVMRLLDCMARYKLNRFHFHLTDDEGWRLAIPALPELTEVGARRGVAGDGTPCLPPSFGSGAAPGVSAGSGHYSAEDFIAILRYAHARHIEVIPEFNLPGHARAAIAAMRVRWERLRAAGDTEAAERFLLHDPDDRSEYESVQLWHDNVICIALPSVDRFIDTVVAETCSLFRRAGVPLRAIHTGGDEVPAGAWLRSPRCHAKMAANGWTDVAQLREDFTRRYRVILANHGVTFAAWDETAVLRATEGGKERLLPNPRFAGLDFHVYVWNNAWGSGQEDLAYRLANAGYTVVLANAAHLYFDLAYAKDPEEPGYYWAGFVETRSAFAFCPLDATVAPGRDPIGRPPTLRDLETLARLEPEAVQRIAGLQGQLWAENARSRERLEYLAAPRLIALAERAWAPVPSWQGIRDADERAACIARDWNEFANRLGQRELPRLDRAPLAYGYRLPPPGVVLDGGMVQANVALPGLAMRYTLDGSEPHAGSARYDGPILTGGNAAEFRIATFDTRGRKSRTVVLDLGASRHA